MKKIWPLWVAAGIQLPSISSEPEQGTSCTQPLPVVLLMTQAASPAEVFCVQLAGRSIMFCVSLNGRITAKETAKSFFLTQPELCSEGHLSRGFFLPLDHVEAEGKVAFVCEMLGHDGSNWGGGKQENCMQFPKVCGNRTKSAKMGRI